MQLCQSTNRLISEELMPRETANTDFADVHTMRALAVDTPHVSFCSPAGKHCSVSCEIPTRRHPIFGDRTIGRRFPLTRTNKIETSRLAEGSRCSNGKLGKDFGYEDRNRFEPKSEA